MIKLGTWILCGLALSTQALTARADALSSQLLFSRPVVRSPSLSPDGNRLAAVADTGHEQNSLVIFNIEGNKLKPLLKTSVPGLVDVTDYRWINNDVLLLWIDVGAGDGSVWAVLNISKGVLVQLKHKFARLLQDHWGDADHVLVWELCEVDKICVYNWNISIDNGLVYTTPLSTSQGPRLRMQGTDKIVAELHGSGDQIQRLIWDPVAHNWLPTGDAASTSTFRAEDSVRGPYAARFEALKSRTPEVRPVETSGTHQVVGASAPPPGPAFLSFADALRSPSAQLEEAYANRRFYWSGISDDLQHALIVERNVGQPPNYLLWSASEGVGEVARAMPGIEAARLGAVRVENDWLDDGSPVAVTTPPAGIAVTSALLIPVLAGAAEARERFVDFDPQTQVFAQNGIVSIRVQVPVADEKGLHNQDWRNLVTQRLTRAAEHIRQAGVSPATKPCVGGTFEAAYAALAVAAAKPDQFACVYAIDLPFKPEFLSKPILIMGMRGHPNREWNMTGSYRRWVAMMGADDAGANPMSWVSQLPSRILLIYNMTWDSFGRAIKPHADPFIAEMKKAGKPVQVYAAESDFDQTPKWEATMNDALTSFIQ